MNVPAELNNLRDLFPGFDFTLISGESLKLSRIQVVTDLCGVSTPLFNCYGRSDSECVEVAHKKMQELKSKFTEKEQ